MYKTTISRKVNEDETQAVFITNSITKEKIFAFWYNPKIDNPLELKPRDAVYELIFNAGYHDLEDYFNHKKG